MELKIIPYIKNLYPKKGIFIKGNSLDKLLQEIENLNIDVFNIKSYAIPSNYPNILYGCFIISDNINVNIGKNYHYICANKKLYLPENSDFYPKLNIEDFENINFDIFFHPEIGIVKLEEEINWSFLVNNPIPLNTNVFKPSFGVKIPKEINSYSIEISDEKLLEAFENTPNEAEWMKNLPFDKQKILNGNKKEAQKLINYLNKHPERAMELGIPLDTLNTSRGDGFFKFRFNKNWFLSSGIKGGLNRTNLKPNRLFILIFFIIFALFKFTNLNKNSDKYNTTNISKTESYYQIDKTNVNKTSKIKKQGEEISPINTFIVISVYLALIFVFLRVRGKKIDLGGNKISSGAKFVIIIILIGMITYTIYPLLSLFGFNFFILTIIILIILLLLRLFNKDKTILNHNDE